MWQSDFQRIICARTILTDSDGAEKDYGNGFASKI